MKSAVDPQSISVRVRGCSSPSRNSLLRHESRPAILHANPTG